MSSMNQINIDQIKSAVESNPKYKAILDLYSERQRGRQDSTVPRTRRVLKEDKHVDVTAQELAEFFRLMQEANAGKFQAGRKVNSGRFVWNYNLKSIADVVNGKAVPITNAPRPKRRLPNVRVEEIAEAAPVIAPTPVEPEASPLQKFAAEAFPSASVQHRTMIVRKGDLEIEIHLDELTQDDLKSAAVLLNNLASA